MTHASGGVFSLEDLPSAGQLPFGHLDMPLPFGYGAVELPRRSAAQPAEAAPPRGRRGGVSATSQLPSQKAMLRLLMQMLEKRVVGSFEACGNVALGSKAAFLDARAHA